jgi:hypothetical protein
LITRGGDSTLAPSAFVLTFSGIDATLEVIIPRALAHVGTLINSARVAVMPALPKKLKIESIVFTGARDA